MKRLHFVGDGDRDEFVLPLLVAGILDAKFDSRYLVWGRLHKGGSGYRRKLAFAVRQAVDDGSAGLAAVVDRDKSGGARLSELRKGREQEQAQRVFPIAVGMADRHVESWLLDDEKTVREALRLPKETRIAHSVDAKPRLHEHWLASPRRTDNPAESEIDMLNDIARGVSESRCNHAKQTGFSEFSEDVRRELGPLFEAPHRAA